MTALADHLAGYLAARRALGFQLEQPGHELPQLVAFVEQAGSPVLTVDLMVAWAQQPRSASPITWRHRISAARMFAAYMATIDPATEVPAHGILAARQERREPYIWSAADTARLVDAAAGLSPQPRGAAHAALLGLLAATGMRVGEALALARGDADLGEGVLTVRGSKSGRARLVPLHPTATAALREYAAGRDRRRGPQGPGPFFVNARGTALGYGEVRKAFVGLTDRLGLRSGPVAPRIHDLRHAFAVETLIGWYRDGADVGSRIGVLSAYLGHVSPTGTYWYLSAVPELMELAAGRLDLLHGGPR